MDLDNLETQLSRTKVVQGDVVDEFESTEEESLVDKLRTANEELKRSNVLLEYLCEPNFVKTITKRERDAMYKQIVANEGVTDDLDEAIEEYEEENDL